LGASEYLNLFPFANNLQFIANNLPAYHVYLFLLTKRIDTEVYDSVLLNQVELEIINIYLSCPNSNHLPGDIIATLPDCYRIEALISWCKMPEGLLLCRNNLITLLKLLPLDIRYQFAALVTRHIDSLSSDIVKPIPIISTMKLLTDSTEQIKYLKLVREQLGSNYIINQFCNSARDWREFKRLRTLSNYALEHEDIQKLFLKTFRKIYMALFAGQTSFFKQSNIFEKYTALSPEWAIEIIYIHAAQNPNSRTAKALSLMKTHDSYNSSNTALLNDIYIYSYANSGLFKRSMNNHTYRMSGFVYSTSAVTENVLTELSTKFERASFRYPNSRRAKIYKELIAGEDGHENVCLNR
jgi:hypothetical protein